MKKTITIVAIIASALLFAFWSSFSSTKVDKQVALKSEKIAEPKAEVKNIKNLVSHQHPHVQHTNEETSITENNSITAIDAAEENEKSTTFSRSETAEKVLKASGKLRENLQGEVYLEVDNDHISSLEAGDTLELEVPYFDMYQNVEIESTKFDSRGNKTLNAKFLMNEDQYTTTITINGHAIYGHIETPHGTYSIAGDGQYAWMAESQDLVRGAVPDQIGGNSQDGSADPQPITEPKPIEITDK